MDLCKLSNKFNISTLINKVFHTEPPESGFLFLLQLFLLECNTSVLFFFLSWKSRYLSRAMFLLMYSVIICLGLSKWSLCLLKQWLAFCKAIFKAVLWLNNLMKNRITNVSSHFTSFSDLNLRNSFRTLLNFW